MQSIHRKRAVTSGDIEAGDTYSGQVVSYETHTEGGTEFNRFLSVVCDTEQEQSLKVIFDLVRHPEAKGIIHNSEKLEDVVSFRIIAVPAYLGRPPVAEICPG